MFLTVAVAGTAKALGIWDTLSPVMIFARFEVIRTIRTRRDTAFEADPLLQGRSAIEPRDVIERDSTLR